jgi:hypothetical protein
MNDDQTIKRGSERQPAKTTYSSAKPRTLAQPDSLLPLENPAVFPKNLIVTRGRTESHLSASKQTMGTSLTRHNIAHSLPQLFRSNPEPAPRPLFYGVPSGGALPPQSPVKSFLTYGYANNRVSACKPSSKAAVARQKDPENSGSILQIPERGRPAECSRPYGRCTRAGLGFKSQLKQGISKAPEPTDRNWLGGFFSL